MASKVDICNLALSHLGDTASVSSIDPPEGSAQAEHCARYYPIARDSLLELHPWGFATKRVDLAIIGSGLPEWDYCYAQPADALNVIAVLPPASFDDYSVGALPGGYQTLPMVAGYVPQPFACELNADGQSVILTDQKEALLRYTTLNVDESKFSPLFVMTLSWHLASMLAGAIIKGDAGAAEAKRCSQFMNAYLSQAIESDASQRRIAPAHNVGWIAGR
jgi:hypothetical protein